MAQFGRIAELEVTSGNVKKTFKDLRIEFNVQKSVNKQNEARISISNLNNDSRDFVVSERAGRSVVLRAGYAEGDGLIEIFRGDIVSASSQIAPPIVLTSILARDGNVALQKNISMSFAAGVDAKNILKEIVNSFPISKDLKEKIIKTKYISSGFSFTGNIKEAMDKISEYLGLEWSIQNEVVKVFKIGESDDSKAVVLSPRSGLKLSPERVIDSVRKAKGVDKEIVKGWKLKTILQPTVQAGGRVFVESREIKERSLFKVESINHTGDTHSDVWDSDIFVKE